MKSGAKYSKYSSVGRVCVRREGGLCRYMHGVGGVHDVCVCEEEGVINALVTHPAHAQAHQYKAAHC